nr:hypothetical protein [Tanacetum cinerariifolium]
MRIVLMCKKKLKSVEQPMAPSPNPKTTVPNTIDKYYEYVNIKQEAACLMILSMSPDLQRTLEKFNAYDMLKELKTMFEEQEKHKLFKTGKAFHACKQEDGQSMIVEVHAMLQLYEKGILKKAENPVVLAIREGEGSRRTRRNQKGQTVMTRDRISLLVLPSLRSHHLLREIIRQKTLYATTARRALEEAVG